MYYAEDHHNSEEDEDNESERQDCLHQRDGNLTGTEELHFDEKWFHGKLSGGRNQAEALLHKYSHLGDGTFLVRDSDTFVGLFTFVLASGKSESLQNQTETRTRRNQISFNRFRYF